MCLTLKSRQWYTINHGLGSDPGLGFEPGLNIEPLKWTLSLVLNFQPKTGCLALVWKLSLKLNFEHGLGSEHGLTQIHRCILSNAINSDGYYFSTDLSKV